MTKVAKTALTTVAVLLGAGQAAANTYILEKGDTKAFIGGFAEFDAITDSTRSLTEVQGSTPVDLKNTANGANGRTQFGVRNSRFDFGLETTRGTVKTKGYLEFDLLGFDPAPGSPATNSEAGYFQNPTLRVRHAYLQASGEGGWQILTGQYWSLFGWQADYVPSTISVAPITGVLYERTPQATFMQTWGSTDDTNFQAALSLSRPAQRDADVPNIDLGVRLRFGQRRAAFVGTSGDIKADAGAIAVSGTSRTIVRPTTFTAASQKHYQASAVAVDTMIPLIGISKGEAIGNTLALSGEYTSGTGYGDQFPSYSGNMSQLLSSNPGQPNLDAGLAGYTNDANKDFKLVRLQSWNASLQYHLPSGMNTFTTAGFAELSSENAADLSPASGKLIYTRNQTAFVNLLHDFDREIRAGIEYNFDRTRYADNSHGVNNRVQISTWYRF